MLSPDTLSFRPLEEGDGAEQGKADADVLGTGLQEERCLVLSSIALSRPHTALPSLGKAVQPDV